MNAGRHKRQELASAEETIRSAIVKISAHAVSESSLAAMVHHLIATGGNTSRRQARAANPMASGASSERTKRELRAVTSAVDKLTTALAQLHGPAASIYRDLDGLKRTVFTIGLIAAFGGTEPDDFVDTSLLTPSPQEALAHAAAKVFLMTTGNKPTIINREREKASGPFIDFLDAIFTARGITASRENTARSAIAAMEKTALRD